MKRIAVIGFENLKDFREWACKIALNSEKEHILGKDYLVNQTDKIEYRCILHKRDMLFRTFDGKIIGGE